MKLREALEAVLEAAQKQQELQEENGESHDAWADACAAVELQSAIDTVRVAQAKERFTHGHHDDPNVFDILFKYYEEEMPYGTQKARTGDPYEWINDHVLEESCVECGGLDWTGKDEDDNS